MVLALLPQPLTAAERAGLLNQLLSHPSQQDQRRLLIQTWRLSIQPLSTSCATRSAPFPGQRWRDSPRRSASASRCRQMSTRSLIGSASAGITTGSRRSSCSTPVAGHLPWPLSLQPRPAEQIRLQSADGAKVMAHADTSLPSTPCAIPSARSSQRPSAIHVAGDDG